MRPALLQLKKRAEGMQSAALYRSIVIGSTIFLIAVAACRWGSDSFTAETQLTLTRKKIQSAWPSSEAWQQILGRALSWQLTATGKGRGLEAVSLRVDADSTPLFLNVTLRYVDRDRQTAIAGANHWGNRLMEYDFAIADFSQSDATWHMLPARKAVREIAPLTTATLLGCLLLAAFTLGLFSLWFHYRQGTLQTKQSIENVLKTRVLAHLPSATDATGSERKSLFHSACFIGEWVLMGMLLAALAVSVIDKHFAHQFFHQPVSALADSLRQLTAITWS